MSKLPAPFEKKFTELPGEQFEEYLGYGTTYSIHEGVVYANWRKPIKWQDETKDRLFETFELGFGATMAAWSLRLSIETVEWWLVRGEVVSRLKSQGFRFHPKVREIALLYGEIYEGCMEAKARGIARRLNRVEAAQEWRAQAWLLEKLVPDFAPKQQVNLNIDFSKLSDEELDKVARTGKL